MELYCSLILELAEGLGQKAALGVKYFFACTSLSFYDGVRQC